MRANRSKNYDWELYVTKRTSLRGSFWFIWYNNWDENTDYYTFPRDVRGGSRQ